MRNYNHQIRNPKQTAIIKNTNLKPSNIVLDIGKIGFVIYLFFGISALGFGEPLQFKFSPGDKYSLAMVTEQKSARVADGNEQTSEQTTRLECDFDVEEVDETGCAWVKYTYKRITLKVRSGKQKADFDSDANQLKTPLQVLPLRMAMGEGVYLRITPQGRIEKINGLPSLITTAKAKMGTFTGAEKVMQGIDEVFAEQTLKRELEDRFRIFPEPNESGTTWSQTSVLSPAEAGYGTPERTGEVNIIYDKTFRLKSSGGQSGVAVVDVNLVIKTVAVPGTSTPIPGTPAKNDLQISGWGTGQIEIEEATGRIINSKMTEDVTERLIYAAQGPMLRPPPPTEPVTANTVSTLQMTLRLPRPTSGRIEAGQPPAPSKAEGDEPAHPADANQKG